mgnify:CR=1 FL=1
MEVDGSGPVAGVDVVEKLIDLIDRWTDDLAGRADARAGTVSAEQFPKKSAAGKFSPRAVSSHSGDVYNRQ